MTYLCLHAHFYQPTREDPWTGVWPDEPTATPWRNWNERITDECYAPNAAARLLDGHGKRRAVRSNYASLSYDVGPTLLQWLAANRAGVHDALVRADQECARERGRGPAMAQGYHHAILPLCDARDRRTEIMWGVRDFALRYGRPPDGFWLPEAAVDSPTLDALVDAGIRFVVLAPRQVRRVRPIGSETWLEASEVDETTRRALRVTLPSGRTIAVFAYDATLAQDVAFGDGLRDGEALGRRLIDEALRAGGDSLTHFATDGESYGHHHKFGEMALARAMEVVEQDGRVRLTTYGAHLDRVPPSWEAEIFEQTSWSCAHGVERWRSDCGCHFTPGTHQRWRAPLRAALDALRDSAREALAPVVSATFRDFDAARDAYVELLQDRSNEAFHAWLHEHGGLAQPTLVELHEAHAALEIHRHLLAMYTSCGWFFDEVTGLESRLLLRHAACAVGLLQEVFGVDLSGPLLQAVAAFPSNEDVTDLVADVDHARRVPNPVHAPHQRAALDTLAEEGEALGPLRQPAVPASFPRAAGMLLHVTSLPGDGPVGDLDAAYDAIDWMHDAGFGVWQVLPLCPPGLGGSPYSSGSALSGSFELIGLGPLVEAGLLTSRDRVSPEPPIGQVDPVLAATWKQARVLDAAKALLADVAHPWHDAVQRFADANPWAREAALYAALHEAQGGLPWWSWPDPLRRRTPDALAEARQSLKPAIELWIAREWIFERQWRAVRDYATARGVRILGDVPIYVGHDSADAWASREVFQLDPDGIAKAVSGVPPDVFSELGQRWGNPLFDWDAMAKDGFAWWRGRLRRAFSQVDALRLDHFIGFVRYWSVPADSPDARHGRWIQGPGRAFFESIEARLGAMPIIAEDLGDVGPDVSSVQEGMGYPGMRVLQFGLDGDRANPHRPSNHPVRSVVYTGTHDNDTLLGWWNQLTPEARAVARQALHDPRGAVVWEIIQLALHSASIWAVLSAQDVLGLGSEARMNVPGTSTGNWTWRLRPGQLDAALARRVRDAVMQSGRLLPHQLS